MIPNNILERRFTSVEVLPHTTLLAVVEWETRLVPTSIEALIQTKMIIGVTNKVDILGARQAVDAHVVCFSALFTRYLGIDHFEMIEARVLKLLHKKINLGGEHVHLFKLVNNVECALHSSSGLRPSSQLVYELPQYQERRENLK
jgi:hypothetical protein